MRHHWLAFMAAVVLGCAFSASAGDKEVKPAKQKEEKKVVEVKTEKRGSDCKFKSFWIHTVGGTIGNGLKSGARKISNTFD